MRLGAITAVGLLLAGVAGTALEITPAAAATGPVFTVMNTSETLPDGVWFRNSPHNDDTNRETGFGVYMYEQVQASCYEWGDAVGPYSNQVWYYATDITRPSVNGHANVGYINTHYVNDGMSANQVYPGIPLCGGPPPPPPPPSALIYYSPYNVNDPARYKVSDSTVSMVYKANWSTGTCGNSRPAYDRAMSYLQPGQAIKTLSGWSLGRTGPIYFLQNAQSQLGQINYIILIDPGYYSQLACDRQINAGVVLANWLQANLNAHLVVISSYQVSQQNSSKGIQETYFNAIRNLQNQTGSDLRSRVLTCNYGTATRFSHQDAFYSGQYWIAHEIGTSLSSCPTLRDDAGSFAPTYAWHP